MLVGERRLGAPPELPQLIRKCIEARRHQWMIRAGRPLHDGERTAQERLRLDVLSLLIGDSREKKEWPDDVQVLRAHSPFGDRQGPLAGLLSFGPGIPGFP